MIVLKQDFMDEDDDSTLGRELKARSQFDTFGKGLREQARASSDDALSSLLFEDHRVSASGAGRAPAIPGPVIDELIVPSSEPIGKRLLAAMGWREGQGIGPRAKRKQPTSVYASNPAAAAGVDAEDDDETGPDPHAAGHLFAPRNTAVFDVAAKNDVYGLGYDPHHGAPEFQRKPGLSGAQSRSQSSRGVVTVGAALVSGKSGGGFGLGVLSDDEDVDKLGGDVDVYGVDVRDEYHRSLEDEEDEPSRHDKSHHRSDTRDRKGKPHHDTVSGFVRSSLPRHADKVYTLPSAPKDYRCVHTFTDAEEAEFRSTRALVGAIVGKSDTASGKQGHAMTAQSRALLLGEKPVLPPTQATPAPAPMAQPSSVHAAAAQVAESRFVSSTAVSASIFTGPQASVGGLMSRDEFESR